MAHPLLDGGQVLTDSDAVLISLVGGTDLTLVEIDKMMEPLKRQCENAHIIFGAAIDEQFAGRLSVALIASCRPPSDAKTTAPQPVREIAGDNTPPLHFLDKTDDARPPARVTPPPPEMTTEQKQHLLNAQNAKDRKKLSRMQRELPLEIVFKGRFDKSEPTIRHGQDLDLPTYIRRGVPLN